MGGLLVQDGREFVIMALRCGRDQVYFTNRRILGLDTQGITGKSKQYISIPYRSVQDFKLTTPSNFALDFDGELVLNVRAIWPLDNSSPKFTISGGYRKDLAKSVDMMALQLLLADRLTSGYEINEPICTMAQGKSGWLTDQYASHCNEDSWLWLVETVCGNQDLSMMTSEELKTTEERLQSSPKLLNQFEELELAFRAGQDMLLLTNRRILWIDRTSIVGNVGEKMSYQSFTLEAGGYAFTTTGSTSMWEEDTELQLFKPSSGWPLAQFGMRKGAVDQKAVFKWLGKRLVTDGPASGTGGAGAGTA